MNVFNKFTLLILTFCWVGFSNAQSKMLKLLEQEKYEEIVRLNGGKTVAKKRDYPNQKMLAYAYSRMEITDKAFDSYFELAEKYPNEVSPLDLLYFSLSARKMEMYGLSDSLILFLKDNFYAGIPLFDELTPEFYEENKDKREDYWAEFNFSDNYVTKKVPQNSSLGDYGIVATPDGNAYFTQTQKETGLWKVRSASHFNPYNVIVKAKFNDSTIGAAKEVGFNKCRVHQYVSHYDEANGIVYITRNANKPNANKETLLQVFGVKQEGKKWEEIPFQLNNDKFNVADLVISPDGSKVVFVSDMPGGYGKSDLYEAPVISNGPDGVKIGEPVNMGPQINTMLRDNFPRFSNTGDFYFSSEGHLGFGGLDIYTVDRNSNMILNVGKPMNSSGDDFAPAIVDSYGLFASNREGKSANDDLYYFRVLNADSSTAKPTQDELIVEIFDEETGAIIPGASFAIDNLEDDNLAIKGDIDSSGSASYNDIPKDAKVQLSSHPCGYKYGATSDYFVTPDGKRKLRLGLQKYKVGEDLGVLFEVKPIYYEVNSYELTRQSKEELDRVAIVLRDNPGLRIQLGSHTDSRGSNELNQALSTARAKSVYDYLVKIGVQAKGLSYKGFGESKIINKCFDGVNCTDEEHALNRRTEYIISGLLPCDGSEFIASNRAAVSNEAGAGSEESSEAGAKSNSRSKNRNNFIDPKELVQADMKVGDADGDGIPDYLDPDSDNDGIPDATEGRADADKDGLPNFIDLDSDNDGIPDRMEGSTDFDRDGKKNFLDTDSDNDGIPDSQEGVGDADNDGNPNYLDLDSDGDGTSDMLESTRDSDGDGVMNFLDQDSDNDGIPDNVEGIKDVDRDGIPNYRDDDSDNDGIPDKVEGTKDSDNDGKPDYIDTDSDEDGIPDKFEAPANYAKYPKDLVPNIAGAPQAEIKERAPAPPVEKTAPKVDNKSSWGNYNTPQASTKVVPGVVYRVQMKMSLKPISENKFLAMGLKDIYMYRSGKYYKYCAGSFKTEQDAEAYKNALRVKGFKDAFVVKFDDGVRVMK